MALRYSLFLGHIEQDLVDKVEKNLITNNINDYENPPPQISEDELTTLRLRIVGLFSSIHSIRSFSLIQDFRRLPYDIQTDLQRDWQMFINHRINQRFPPTPVPTGSQKSVSRSRSARSVKTSSDLTLEKQNALHPTCRDLLKSGRELTTEIINGEEIVIEKPVDIINSKNQEFYNSSAGRNLRGFINKLKKSCSKVVDKERCTITNLDTITKQLLERYRIEKRYTEIYEIRGDLNKLELINLYETYKIHLNIFKSSINKDSTDIKIIATQAQDQGGVRKDFMQNAINQLFSTKLFESINKFENQDVYNFNWNVDIHSIFNIPNTTENKHDVFKFIGSLIAFAIINKIPLPYHLNRGILANLLYKPEEITDEEYALFYMLDDASSGISIASALSNPTTHIDEFYQFNNEDHTLKPSISQDDPNNNITTKNFREYITLLSKYKLIKENNSDLALKAFKQGFFITRRTLRKKPDRDITISMLDKLITSTELSTEAIDIIVDNVTNSIRYNNENEKLIGSWFIDILKNKIPYPIDDLIQQGHTTVPNNHKEFLQNLLKCWTGISGFNNNLNYIITFDRTFSSHTCGNVIHLPRNWNISSEDFYIKLVTHVTACKGFQFL